MDVRAALASQYHSALAMLRETVALCPDELWLDDSKRNAYWRIAYHAVFFGHLYLMPDEAAFTPWEKHREEYQFLGNLPWPPNDPPNIGEPYLRSEVLEYLDLVDGLVDGTLARVDLDAGKCGFWWYELPKLDHEILSIRHVMHHTGQLADRLRNHAGTGVRWVG